MEVYLRQAKNTEAERRACEIRLRAERKAGTLLAEREKAKSGPPIRNRSIDTTDYRGAPTLRDLGISKQQSSDWQRLAWGRPYFFKKGCCPRSRPIPLPVVARSVEPGP